MISTNAQTGEWKIVGQPDKELTYSVEHTMQESLVGNFIKDWFNISSTPIANSAAWEQCDRATCGSGDGLMFGTRRCVIYCSVGDDVFSRFLHDVLPDYQNRADNGEVWRTTDKDIAIRPVGAISSKGGTWQVRVTVSSATTEDFEVIAFIKVARNSAHYPKTMGYYIADMNSYRIN
jgi:hypothetical protein